jgi:hypothetical protein
VTTSTVTSGYLFGRGFDAALIGGVLALSLALGALGLASEEAFYAVVLVDVWLLAYPHVASTYTRIAFDRASARRWWFFLTLLFPIVLALTLATTWLWGVVFLNSLYFYWQTLHYARQSWGISRAFGWAGLRRHAPDDGLVAAVVGLFPVWGLVQRAAEGHTFFYSSELWVPALPSWLASAIGALAMTTLVVWVVGRILRGPRGHLPQTLFVLSHCAITAVSYLLISDVTRGWLFVNVWHNAQYLLFVWAINAREHRAPRPGAELLHWLCQPRRAWIYTVVCLALATAIYSAFGAVASRLDFGPALPAVMVTFLAFNFHHYLIDTFIWRSKAPSPRT